MISLEHFFNTLVSTLRDVIPIAVIIFGFQLAVLRRPVNNLKKVLFGFAYVILGLSLFFTRFRNGAVSFGRNHGYPVNYA